MAARGMLPQLVEGVTAPIRGLRFLLGHTSLRRLAVAPLAINAVVFAIAIVVFFVVFDSILAVATGFLAVAAGTGILHAVLVGLALVAKTVIAVVIIVAFAAALFFGFTLVGGLIAAPFNEVLSQRAEAVRLGQLGLGAAGADTASTSGFRTILREASYAFGAELRRTGFYLLVMALLALLNLLPGFGTLLFSVLGTLASCYFFAWDHTDLPMSRRRLSFAEKRRILARHRLSALAFGSVALGITAVPFLNLLMLPVQTVAGTLLYLDWAASAAPATASATGVAA